MPGIPGRKGYLPTCHTEMCRWAVENGYTAAHIARVIGVHHITVLRHFLGWPIWPVTSRLYRSYFPGMPVPERGRPQVFEHPLPIRHLPRTRITQEGPPPAPGASSL